MFVVNVLSLVFVFVNSHRQMGQLFAVFVFVFVFVLVVIACV